MDAQLSMMPTLFASCTIPVHRPRIDLGTHSETYEGTSAETIPTPSPAKKRLKYSTRRATVALDPMPTRLWMRLPMR